MRKQSDGTILSLRTLVNAHLCVHRVKEFAPTEDEKWVQEFENQVSSQGRTLASVAKELTETVTDPEINATEVSGSSSPAHPPSPTSIILSTPPFTPFYFLSLPLPPPSSFPPPSSLPSSFLLSPPPSPSQFIDFVSKLSTGEARFDDQQEVS